MLFTTSAKAQVAGASIIGTVRDASGAVIPQATIALHNTATGVERTVPLTGDNPKTRVDWLRCNPQLQEEVAHVVLETMVVSIDSSMALGWATELKLAGSSQQGLGSPCGVGSRAR
jgi:hypothetical protein